MQNISREEKNFQNWFIAILHVYIFSQPSSIVTSDKSKESNTCNYIEMLTYDFLGTFQNRFGLASVRHGGQLVNTGLWHVTPLFFKLCEFLRHILHNFPNQIVLQLFPHVLDRIHVWGLAWLVHSGHPLPTELLLDILGMILGVIVILVNDHCQDDSFKNVFVEVLIHNSFDMMNGVHCVGQEATTHCN